MLSRSTYAALSIAFAAALVAPSSLAGPKETTASAVDSATLERSRAAFRRGVVQLRAQDWAGARASFEEAWGLVQHPSILLNLGIARLHTGDPVLAEQDLVRFLSEDPEAAAEEQATARDALIEARSKIGTLRVVASPPSARVVVDGKPLAVRVVTPEGSPSPQAVAEGRFKAGEHALRVEAEGHRSRIQKVDLKAKSDTEVTVTLGLEPAASPEPPPPSSSSTRRIVGWSLAGTSAVALVTSGVLGLRAISLASDYGDRSSPSFQKSDVKSEGIAFRTGADVALIAAVLAGAGAVVLLLTDVGKSSAAASAARDPSIVRW